MMKQLKTLLILLLLFMSSIKVYAQFEQPKTETAYLQVFEKGMSAIKMGHYKKALNTWIAASDVMDEYGYFDARVGFKFIEIVTSKSLKEYYDEACDLYFLALDKKNIGDNPLFEENKIAILEEVKRLKPLLEFKTFKNWKKGIEENNGEVLDRVVQFWRKMDYTSTTSYNERLLEHWERIAYAVDNFTKNKNTVYGTDDRANIYIKFGDPFIMKEDILSFDFAHINRLVREVALLENQKNQDNNLFGGNANVANSNLIANATHSTAEIQHFYNNPKYSVWIYHKLHNDKLNPIIYLFGEDGNSGRYQQLRAVEDMIPSQSYRRTNTLGNSNVTPSAFLQLMMYNKLSVTDDYFGKAYNELRRRMMDFNSPITYQLSHEFRSKHVQELQNLQNKAPDDFSSDLTEKYNLDITGQTYRVLVDNEPNIMVLMRTKPKKLFDVYKQLAANDSRLSTSNVKLQYALEVFATDGYKKVMEDRYPEFTAQPVSQTQYQSAYPHSNVLLNVPYTRTGAELKYSALIVDTTLNQNVSENSTYPENILGVGTKISQIDAEPLSTDPNRLTLSDPVLGYGDLVIDEFKLPFYVSSDGTIPQGENLKFMLETYHLQPDSLGSYAYKLSYSINEKKKLFGFISRKKSRVEVTLNLHSSKPTNRNILEVETQSLVEGNYTFEITAEDQYSNQIRTKTVDFTIK